MIEIGIEEGATLAAGGVEKPDGCEKGYYVSQQFLQMSLMTTIAKEEIFGPVLVMIKYNDEDEAINIAMILSMVLLVMFKVSLSMREM